jgi:hypothetical protein
VLGVEVTAAFNLFHAEVDAGGFANRIEELQRFGRHLDPDSVARKDQNGVVRFHRGSIGGPLKGVLAATGRNGVVKLANFKHLGISFRSRTKETVSTVVFSMGSGVLRGPSRLFHLSTATFCRG